MEKAKGLARVFLYFLCCCFLIVSFGCSEIEDWWDDDDITGVTLSGTITGDDVSNVTVNLSGTKTDSTITNTSGEYEFNDVPDGTYQVTPAKIGVAFDPVTQVVTVGTEDTTAPTTMSSTTTETLRSISGAVSGAVTSGVQLTLSGTAGGTIVTGTNGTYSFAGLQAGNYTVTPTLAGYTFTPASSTITITTNDVTGVNFTAAAAAAGTSTFSQADLTGTWYMNELKTGSDGFRLWQRCILTINSNGYLTFSSYERSDGNTDFPPANKLRLTIDTNGVITLSGSDSAIDNTSMHSTMASNKTFAAGTQTDEQGRVQLVILQKKVAGTTYSNADLQGKSLVWHGLYLEYDGNHKWVYGSGSTNASGYYTGSSEVNSRDGSITPGGGDTFSVNSEGVVTMSDNAGWKGFLSADKKTIVATETTDHGGGNLTYTLMVLQITGQTYTAGPVPDHTATAHMLVAGTTYLDPLWAHWTLGFTGGTGAITISDWESSNAAITFSTGSATAQLSVSGVVTITGVPSYHGQVSDDGTFVVATRTLYATINTVQTPVGYALQVNTKR